MSKNLRQRAQGVDVSPLRTAAARHKMCLPRLHADGAVQSREAVSRDVAVSSCRHYGARYKANRWLETACSVGTIASGWMATGPCLFSFCQTLWLLPLLLGRDWGVWGGISSQEMSSPHRKSSQFLRQQEELQIQFSRVSPPLLRPRLCKTFCLGSAPHS